MNKKIVLNQLGYCRNMRKTAAFVGYTDEFGVVDALTGKTVFEAAASDPVSDRASSDTVSVLDFSAFDRCGSYYIRAGRRRSPVFTISEKPYAELKKAMLKGLYYNRCASLDRRWAGVYAHDQCHSEPVPLFGSSAKHLDVSGGWHDSGGYGKFTVCTCVTLGHLLYAYKLFPESFGDSSDIPES